MIERGVENYLVEQVALLGGVAEKVHTLGVRGFFDRLIVLPGGRVIFCEVKRPKGGRVSPHQHRRVGQYRSLGAEVAIVHNLEEVDALLSG